MFCLCLAGGFMKPGDKDTWGYKMFTLISWSCVLEMSFRWHGNVFTGAEVEGEFVSWPKSLRGTLLQSAKATMDTDDFAYVAPPWQTPRQTASTVNITS